MPWPRKRRSSYLVQWLTALDHMISPSKLFVITSFLGLPPGFNTTEKLGVYAPMNLDNKYHTFHPKPKAYYNFSDIYDLALGYFAQIFQHISSQCKNKSVEVEI